MVEKHNVHSTITIDNQSDLLILFVHPNLKSVESVECTIHVHSTIAIDNQFDRSISSVHSKLKKLWSVKKIRWSSIGIETSVTFGVRLIISIVILEVVLGPNFNVWQPLDQFFSFELIFFRFQTIKWWG